MYSGKHWEKLRNIVGVLFRNPMGKLSGMEVKVLCHSFQVADVGENMSTY